MNFDGLQQRIANRIDGFISIDPKRPVDLWRKSSMVTVHKEMIAILDIPKDEEATLLDAGCGVGHLCDNLVEAGYSMDKLLITGFDLSPKAIEEAKSHHPTQDWQVGSFVSNYPTGQFDYSVCAGAFCYYQGKDHWAIFDEQLRKLRASTIKRGIGYVLYTDQVDWRPHSDHNTFVRFHPDALRDRYPDLKVTMNETRMKEAFGSGFADLDIYYVSW